MSEATAFWVVGPRQGELRRGPLRPRRDGEVVVEAIASAISHVAESLVFSGRVPEAQREAMRCPFQVGDFPAPVKYGACSVGKVVEGASELVGRRVFCPHPHQDRYIVPVDALTFLPDGVSDRRALLAGPMEGALNGLWDAAPRIGDRVAVVGATLPGLLAAALASRIPGVSLELIDSDLNRSTYAEALGVKLTPAEDASADNDLVVDASNNEEGLATALFLAGTDAMVLELGGYEVGARPLGSHLTAKRLTVRTSRLDLNNTVSRPRWDRKRRIELALDLLSDPRYEVLLGPPTRFWELPEAMQQLADERPRTACPVVEY